VRRGLLTLLVVATAVLGGTAVALAQDPQPQGSEASAQEASASSSPEGGERKSGLEARVGTLPFTGLDLIVLAGVALLIAGFGFALHRLSAPRI
jgi:hypothetical protein